MDVSPGFQQGDNFLDISLLRRYIERGDAVCVDGIDIGSGPLKQLD